MSPMRLLGGLALALVLVQAVRLSLRLARRLGTAALFPAVLAALLGLLAVGTAEGLSLFHAVRPAGVAACVAAALLASLALGRPRVSFGSGMAALRQAVRAAGGEGRLAAGVLGLLAAVTLLLALASPPNTDDALVYHLPPVRQWLERGSVAHYPTSIDRQLRSPPLAAYLRLPLEALTGTDAPFGLVQWLFYVLATAQAAGVAWLVRGDPRQAWRAAAVAGTLPMAVLQASSTQNDLVVAGYALGAVAGMVALARAPGTRNAERVGLVGVCLGLLALAKGTGLLLAAVLVPALLAVVWRRRGEVGVRTALPAFAAMSLLAAPSLVRNAQTFGQALPHPEAVPAQAWGDVQAPARALFQLERGALVQVQPLLARDPIGGWILRLHGAVRDRLGLKEDDPLLTWTGDAALLRRTSPRHEDTAGNPLHFVLALWAAAVAVRRRDPALAVLVALGGAAWIALTVPVRFSPWLSRLQLPALVLLAVPIALALGEARRRALAIVALLALGSLPPLLGNALKPLVPRGPEPLLLGLSRWENRFRSRPELRPAVEAVIRALPEACLPRATVELQVRGHFPEYALWAGARHFGRDVRFAHPPLDAPACAVLTDRCPRAALCLEERIGSGPWWRVRP